MITGEIKLHEEPKPTYTAIYKPTQPTHTANIIPFNGADIYFSQFELNAEQTRAFNAGIRIGNIYRVKGSATQIKIDRWNIQAGKQEVIDGKPAIISGIRSTPIAPQQNLTFNYSVDEILDMEKIRE